jgi:ankyrin repeat protein
MVKYLIEECKADTNIVSNPGATVLHFALEGKNFDVVKYIVEKCNPDPNAKTDNGINIYHSAVVSENLDILTYIWNKYPNEKALLEEGGDNGWTPFHYAIHYGQSKMVCFFIDKCKVDINIKSKEGYSVMAFAAKYGTANVLRALNTEYELDFNEKFDKRHILFLSIENGNVDSLKFFLDENDIDANIKDHRGWTPMHVAAYFGKLNVIKYLVEEKDCGPYVEIDNKFTPAMIASQQKHGNIIDYLVSKFGTLKTGEMYLY